MIFCNPNRYHDGDEDDPTLDIQTNGPSLTELYTQPYKDDTEDEDFDALESE